MRIAIEGCLPAARQTWTGPRHRSTAAARCWKRKKDSAPPWTRKTHVYRADIQAKKAAIIVSEVNLGYTRIVSPAAGAVSERHVQEGQLVAPGMQVVDLVRGDVWIQANYKETQLTNMQQGDVADITIDTFPGVVLHGKVAEISPASGSQFALLPPDNATGNFTKVVQRIPVKIVLDPDHPLQDRLRPGFSAVVTIHASGKRTAQEGSSVLSAPPSNPRPPLLRSPAHYHPPTAGSLRCSAWRFGRNLHRTADQCRPSRSERLSAPGLRRGLMAGYSL